MTSKKTHPYLPPLATTGNLWAALALLLLTAVTIPEFDQWAMLLRRWVVLRIAVVSGGGLVAALGLALVILLAGNSTVQKNLPTRPLEMAWLLIVGLWLLTLGGVPELWSTLSHWAHSAGGGRSGLQLLTLSSVVAAGLAYYGWWRDQSPHRGKP